METGLGEIISVLQFQTLLRDSETSAPSREIEISPAQRTGKPRLQAISSVWQLARLGLYLR